MGRNKKVNENIRDLLGRKVLNTAEVAELFKITGREVSARAAEGSLPSFRTPGGGYRYYEDEILPLVPKPPATA
jgi:hypothetical protein